MASCRWHPAPGSKKRFCISGVFMMRVISVYSRSAIATARRAKRIFVRTGLAQLDELDHVPGGHAGLDQQHMGLRGVQRDRRKARPRGRD